MSVTLPSAPYLPLITAQIPRSGINPAVHLAKFQAAASPKVAIMGDSTSGENVSGVSWLDALWPQIRRRITEDNPTKTITFGNYGIGGTSLGQWNNQSTALPSQPFWFSYSTIRWIVYVQAFQPHTLFVNWGINDTYNYLLTDVRSFLTTVVSWANALATWQASHAYAVGDIVADSSGRMQVCYAAGTSGSVAPTWNANVNGSTQDNTAYWACLATSYIPRVPDIVFCTNKPGNALAGIPYSQTNYQIGYLSAASLQRSLALGGSSYLNISGLPPIGLIDVGRYFNMAVLGRDPVEQTMTLISPLASALTASSFPFTCPQTDGDFEINITLAASSLANLIVVFYVDSNDGTTKRSQLNVSAAANTGVNASYYPSGQGSLVYSCTSQLIWNNTQSYIILSVRQQQLRVYVNGVVLWETTVPRYMSTFAPIITLAGTVSSNIQAVIAYTYGTMRKYSSILSPSDVYGATNGPSGGNGTVHDSSIGTSGIDGRVLDATRFA